jgi:hypothetical protein
MQSLSWKKRPLPLTWKLVLPGSSKQPASMDSFPPPHKERPRADLSAPDSADQGGSFRDGGSVMKAQVAAATAKRRSRYPARPVRIWRLSVGWC